MDTRAHGAGAGQKRPARKIGLELLQHFLEMAALPSMPLVELLFLKFDASARFDRLRSLVPLVEQIRLKLEMLQGFVDNERDLVWQSVGEPSGIWNPAHVAAMVAGVDSLPVPSETVDLDGFRQHLPEVPIHDDDDGHAALDLEAELPPISGLINELVPDPASPESIGAQPFWRHFHVEHHHVFAVLFGHTAPS